MAGAWEKGAVARLCPHECRSPLGKPAWVKAEDGRDRSSTGGDLSLGEVQA
jgi:hypothetical protein